MIQRKVHLFNGGMTWVIVNQYGMARVYQHWEQAWKHLWLSHEAGYWIPFGG
jgi:hypothetical protein